MTLPVILQSKITLPQAIKSGNLRFPTGGSMTRPYRVTTVNDNLSHDTLSDFRMAAMAPFSSLDTWAWEIPREEATSIWVFPS